MRSIAVIVLGMGILLGVTPGPAAAQWGYGWGMFGIQPSAATNYVNDHALVRAAAAANSRPQALRAPGSGERFRGRDPAFFERYNVESRRSMVDQAARRPARRETPRPVAVAANTPQPAPTPATASAPAPAAPSAPFGVLAGFFNRYDELVWPAEAPIEGDLRAKRITSDQASLATLREQKTKGAAQISTITQARSLLLEYGRPALEYVRTHSTGPVADTFHIFLLNLYESLQQAGTPKAPANNPAPPIP